MQNSPIYLHLQTTKEGSSLSALGAETSAAADFFKVLTISRTKLIRGLLFVAVALASNCKNASIRRGSQRSILLLMPSRTVLILIKVAGEGGDWDREVGLLVDPPPPPR